MSLRAVAVDAARVAGIDRDIFLRMIEQESGWNPEAVSPAGARGIAQFMPATAEGLGVDPDDPEASLYAAANLLRDHLDRFGDYRLALAAYNAGPGAVERHQGVPPYAETQSYVSSILGEADAAPRGQDLSASQARPATRSTAMVSSAPNQSIEMLLGTAIQQMLFGQADTVAGRGLQAGQLTGYIPGDLLGQSGQLIPSLALRQYETDRDNADRNYELDLSRFGLQQAEFNYTQRLGEAQTKLQTMQYLSSLRGPENAFAYNYALNGLQAPAGTPADPTSSITAGLNQQSTQTPVRPGRGGVPVAAGLGAKPPVAPPLQPNVLPKQPPAAFNSNVPGQPGGFANPVTDANPYTNWIDAANQGSYNEEGGAYDDPNLAGYGAYEDLNAAQQAAGGGAIQAPTEYTPGTTVEHELTPGGPSWETNYGRGGIAPAGSANGIGMQSGGQQGGAMSGNSMSSAAIVGDDPNGGDDENEELAIGVNGPIIVLSKLADGKFGISEQALSRFKDQGGPKAALGGAFAPYPGGVNPGGNGQLMDPGQVLDEGQPLDAPRSPILNSPPGAPGPVSGGLPPATDSMHATSPLTQLAPPVAALPTGPVTYTPQEQANAPIFDKLRGRRFNSPIFDTTLPGGSEPVPAYQNLNLARFARLAPSEQSLYKGALETPRAQGGLGLSFLDSLAVAQRHAFGGNGARAGFYGR